MSFKNTGNIMTFGKLYNGAAFAYNTTLYTRTFGKESPKEHVLIKVSRHKAITPDRNTSVHFIGNEAVSLCVREAAPTT